MADDIKELRAKIRALLAKASDAAATEAEAQTAAAFATRLLIKHDIAEADLKEEDRDSAERASPKADKHLHVVQRELAVRIANLTETRVFINGSTLHFVGLPSDLDMAVYLCEMLKSAADRGWMTAFTDQPMRGKKVDMGKFRDGFYAGFIASVSERLISLTRDRVLARASDTSKALMISKRGLIAQKMRDDGIILRGKDRSRPVIGSEAGAAAGMAAGKRVGFGRPVTGSSRGSMMISG